MNLLLILLAILFLQDPEPFASADASLAAWFFLAGVIVMLLFSFSLIVVRTWKK